MLVQEELDYIDIDNILNTEDSPRLCVHRWGMWESHSSPYQPKEEVKTFYNRL